MTEGRATIKDVAARAGVSISTVSRTLSGKMYVEDITKQKVMRAVRELHYEPNMIAKGLKERRTRTLGVVLPDLKSLYYSALTEAIESYASQRNYSVFLSNSHGKVEDEKHTMEVLCKRAVDGMICLTVNDDIGHILTIRRNFGVPIVFINRELDDNISSVSVDAHYGAKQAANYLIEAGHSRIAAFFGGLEKQRYRQRYEGFREALKEAGISERPEYVVDGVVDMQAVYDSAVKASSPH